MGTGKLLILLGVCLIVVGVLWMLGEKIGLGKLPGDFSWGGENFRFYFPLTTCIILSVLATLLLWLFRWWRG